ncbi:MAG: DcrB-related protein [Polyangiaceae bacterium]
MSQGFHVHEGMFQLDDGWTDGTMNVFTRKLKNGGKASLVVTREEQEAPDLATHVGNIVKKLKAQLPRFVEVQRKEATIAGVQGWITETRWRQDGTDLAQAAAFLPVEVTGIAPFHRVVTFTMTVPVSADIPVVAKLLEVVESMKLRKV